MQVQAFSLAALAGLLPCIAASFFALPIAIIAAGLVHLMLASATKGFLVGTVKPGVHQ